MLLAVWTVLATGASGSRAGPGGVRAGPESGGLQHHHGRVAREAAACAGWRAALGPLRGSQAQLVPSRCLFAATHYEIWKYCQCTSKVQAWVLQHLRVPQQPQLWLAAQLLLFCRLRVQLPNTSTAGYSCHKHRVSHL